jgi:hypothetical protein
MTPPTSGQFEWITDHGVRVCGNAKRDHATILGTVQVFFDVQNRGVWGRGITEIPRCDVS